ncbi:glycosyltransferase family 2 protein, partial [Acidisphaera rubrifaciens]|uniref:glycosyltransferase family 2 protein n=1 Tax=Acidisphaera rubrifaciens TaxID=50715 RepID=UPI0006629446
GAGLAYVLYDTALLLFVSWQTLPLLRRPVPPVATGPLPPIGVVIAARNEAGGIVATIDALLAQTPPPARVILADDGSTDATPAVLAARYGLVTPAPGTISPPAPGAPALRWLRLPPRGKAAALNAAIGHLDTELMATIDADTLLAPGALAAMGAAFAAEPSLVAATGVLRPVCRPTPVGRALGFLQTYEYVRNFLSRYAWMGQGSLLLISGAFATFRTEAVRMVGGFDGACLTEDYELIHRLHRTGADRLLGWTVRVIGAARASTDAPADLRTFLRQRRRWFGGFLQTQFWNRDMTANPRYGRLGMLMLPVKALDTLQPIYGLTALALFGVFALFGHTSVIVPAVGVIAAKIGFDLAIHLWSLHLYRRWIGGPGGTSYAGAALAALIEPFCFQPLRHLGATLGWVLAVRHTARTCAVSWQG